MHVCVHILHVLRVNSKSRAYFVYTCTTLMCGTHAHTWMCGISYMCITDVRLKKDPFGRYKNGGKGALKSKSVSSFFCAAESKSGDRNSSTKRSTVKAKKKVTKWRSFLTEECMSTKNVACTHSYKYNIYQTKHIKLFFVSIVHILSVTLYIDSFCNFYCVARFKDGGINNMMLII